MESAASAASASQGRKRRRNLVVTASAAIPFSASRLFFLGEWRYLFGDIFVHSSHLRCVLAPKNFVQTSSRAQLNEMAQRIAITCFSFHLPSLIEFCPSLPCTEFDPLLIHPFFFTSLLLSSIL